ncbi:MAG: hypothetical protein ACRDTJ_22835, partial [Pseudonocardiaceae bacterium]
RPLNVSAALWPPRGGHNAADTFRGRSGGRPWSMAVMSTVPARLAGVLAAVGPPVSVVGV